MTSALFSLLIFVFPSSGFCTSPRLSGDRLDSVLLVIGFFVFSLLNHLQFFPVRSFVISELFFSLPPAGDPWLPVSLSLSLRLPPSSLAPNRLSTTSQLSILQFDNIFILIDPINSILEITPPRSRIPAVFSSFLRVAGGKGCVYF